MREEKLHIPLVLHIHSFGMLSITQACKVSKSYTGGKVARA